MSILTNLSLPISGSGGSTNTILLMPKLQNRFRVTFNIGDKEFITGNVKTVTRPSLAFDPITLDVYNSRIYIPGKHTWNPITVVIRDVVSNSVINALNSQIEKQINMTQQTTPLSAAFFKFATKIETLDGTNGSEPNVLDTWKLAGCYIENIEYGNNDYSTAETVDISVTLKYDNAVNEPKDPTTSEIQSTAGDFT
jgi:hypothetical protein